MSCESVLGFYILLHLETQVKSKDICHTLVMTQPFDFRSLFDSTKCLVLDFFCFDIKVLSTFSIFHFFFSLYPLYPSSMYCALFEQNVCILMTYTIWAKLKVLQL